MKTTLYSSLLLVFIITACSFKKKEIAKSSVAFENIESLSKRDSIINYAKNYLNAPYLYAGNSPKTGFDCSGFVSFVFNHFEVNLPRSSSGYKNLGKPLNEKDFKVGDVLVFYGYHDRNIVGHLGIICKADGMQSEFIHASSGKAQSVTISSLGSDHYTKRFYKCIDVLEL